MADTDAKYVELREAFRTATLVRAPKEKLEEYLKLVCLEGFVKQFKDLHADPQQIAETVRLLLYVRASEEMQKDAARIAKAALRVTYLVCALAVIQVAVAVAAFLR